MRAGITDCTSNSVSKRTRRQIDARLLDIHQRIKKERGEVQDHNVVVDRKLSSRKNHGTSLKLNSTFFWNNSDDESDQKSSDDELEFSSSDEEPDEEFKLNSGKKERKSIKKGTRKVGRPPKKRSRVVGGADVIEGLVASIWKGKDSVDEEPGTESVESEVHQSVITVLPLKFRFEYDDDKKLFEPEESEADCLFREMELALGESEIGCADYDMTDDEDNSSSETDQTSTTNNCTRGVHEPFLDEQIGIICKNCSALLLEIKHVLPPFYVEPPERRETKEFEKSKHSTTNQFQFHGCASDNLESSIHSEGTVMELIRDIEKELYPHQCEGYKFMWRNIAGDIQMKNLVKLSDNQGGGCIMSHAPGTGKTRLTIVFLQSFMKVYPACRPVIIAPAGVLSNWEKEFQKWNVNMKFHNLNDDKLSSHEIAGREELVNEKDKDCIRFLKLLSWTKGEGVLGISYQLFEILTGQHRKKKPNEKFRKILLELPGLLVMDEGHTPRNNQSRMWKALEKVPTKRRVILSGTPFQNNFTELYNTLCLANPRFSHQREEWESLTNSISKNNDNTEVLMKLQSIMEPLVHIHQGDVHQKTLPGMKECLVVVKPTDLQTELLQITQQENFLKHGHLASLISVHPSLVTKNPNFSAYKSNLRKLEFDTRAGSKIRFLFELIKLSAHLGEKVLVFSQFIDPLVHIKKLLKRRLSYNEGQEVIYMDGELGLKQRQCLIDMFNNKSSTAKVMLASQRSCGEGITLVGASRVVFLDVVWNPSVERQAVCRAYRIGQEKVVYVYHLVTAMEVKKYVRQMEKERISELIFSQGGEVSTSENDGGVMEDEVLEAITGHSRLSNMFEKVVHNPKGSDLVDAFGFVHGS